MATLYDLAMQYLNQSLPKTFKYDRTNPPTIGPIIRPPQDPNAPVKRILPVQGGGDGFSVYNPDPNRTRNESNYNERPYKSTVYNDAFPMMGDPMANQATGALNADGLMSYAGDKQLKGLPGAAANYLKNSFVGKGLDALGNMMPVNQRAIYENELLGQGIMLDDIGRIVSDGGNINTAENIMAGYNANKVTAETFQKRRDMINAKMKDPAQKAAKLAALDAAEEKMLGTAKTRADTVFDDKSLAKDPTYKSQQELIELGIKSAEDDKEEDMFNPLNLNTTTAPAFTEFYNPYEKNYTTDPYVSGEDNKDIDPGDGTGSGGSYDEAGIGPGYGGGSTYDEAGIGPGYGGGSTYDEAGIGPGYGGGSTYDEAGIGPGYGGGSTYDEAGIGPGYGGGSTYDEAGVNPGSSYNAGSGYGSGKSSNLGGPAGQGTATAKDTYTDAITRGNTGGGNDSSSNSRDKIVCTMMNESYGFGSFRNKIWLKHSKGLAPEYQKGYHKIFLPLIKIAKTNKVVRKILEHIAVHRTIDIRQESRGKVHLLGRVYRKILEPICYIVGKHGKSSS